MKIGEKIRIIRTFRGMTQKDLGLKVGFDEKSADVRIAQYESDYRVPKMNLINQLAQILDVNPIAIKSQDIGSAEDIMQMLFWIDEQTPIILFDTSKSFENDATKIKGFYNDDYFTSSHPPIGIAIKYTLVNDFLKEWLIRKNELSSGQITKNEYFEWKINWPNTCDNCGNFKPIKKWKK